MSPTAARQVALVAVAIVVGIIVLAKGFDGGGDIGAATPVTTGGGADDTPTDDGATDGTDGGATDTTSDGTTDGGTDGAVDGTATDGTTDGTTIDGTTDGTTLDGTATDGTTDGTTTDAAATVHPPQEVLVLVANGAGVQGAAGVASSELILQNYNPMTPTNATTQDYQASVFYYGPDYEADARQIAQILGGSPDQVQPMPASPPVGDLAGANVLVVIGADLANG
ncbi:MAG: LytR C-terminal domain-containing protein [Acidimicrobiales bacterium]|nr:LytR C-terminal domain-containing protein [Acidimicrobiales bacterium]